MKVGDKVMIIRQPRFTSGYRISFINKIGIIEGECSDSNFDYNIDYLDYSEKIEDFGETEDETMHMIMVENEDLLDEKIFNSPLFQAIYGEKNV